MIKIIIKEIKKQENFIMVTLLFIITVFSHSAYFSFGNILPFENIWFKYKN